MNKILKYFFNILITFLPIISIFVLGRFYPPDTKSYKPIFQPPGYVFGIVWTYVTLSLGIITTFVFNKLLNDKLNLIILIVLYIILLFLLNIWLVIYSKNLFKESFIILLVSAFISIIYLVFISLQNYKYIWFLLPLPFWLIIASCLNGAIYDNSTHR